MQLITDTFYHCLYLQYHGTLKHQNDGLMTVAEGLYYFNNGGGGKGEGGGGNPSA